MLCDSAWKCAEAVMSILGWRISSGEDKRKPFSKSFEILGAVITFKDATIEVSNKETRLQQIDSQFRELKENLGQSLSRSHLESLKGRLLYAAGHTYGRCTQLACQLLHRVGGQGAAVKVTPELVHAVASALENLTTAKPRRVESWTQCPPILLFTDGAVEDNGSKVTHGALLVDPVDSTSFFFGDHVPQTFTKVWARHGKRQVICQAEMFPVLVAKCTWRDRLAFRSILWFMDNESARMAFVRNFSPVIDNFFLLQVNSKFDVDLQSRNWYSRVPSKSNPSDDASRLDFSGYVNAMRCTPCYDRMESSLSDFESLRRLLEEGS
eukprot:s4516_g4.t1